MIDDHHEDGESVHMSAVSNPVAENATIARQLRGTN